MYSDRGSGLAKRHARPGEPLSLSVSVLRFLFLRLSLFFFAALRVIREVSEGKKSTKKHDTCGIIKDFSSIRADESLN